MMKRGRLVVRSLARGGGASGSGLSTGGGGGGSGGAPRLLPGGPAPAPRRQAATPQTGSPAELQITNCGGVGAPDPPHRPPTPNLRDTHARRAPPPPPPHRYMLLWTRTPSEGSLPAPPPPPPPPLSLTLQHQLPPDRHASSAAPCQSTSCVTILPRLNLEFTWGARDWFHPNRGCKSCAAVSSARLQSAPALVPLTPVQQRESADCSDR
jgi:hypothetical protein